MRLKVRNIGQIKSAEIEFGKLTILCGKNNTGKTYITYNIFNYLDSITDLTDFRVSGETIQELLTKGNIQIDLNEYAETLSQRINRSMKEKFTPARMAKMMAANESLYKKASVEIELELNALKSKINSHKISLKYQLLKNHSVVVSKNEGMILEITLINGTDELPSEVVLSGFIDFILSQMTYEILGRPTIITCERTGIGTFMPTFIASRAVHDMRKDDENERMNEEFRKIEFRGYPVPMGQELEFVTKLGSVVSRKSFFASKHPEIIGYFNSISGGTYSLKDTNTVAFTPNDTDLGLTTVESSSAMRSLMELNFYLKHTASEGQILMIDEPELNLHPENQRKVARLLAMLVNAGINVVITTHSDYIIREFNTLIMLNNKKVRNRAKEFNYSKQELLAPRNVRCYVIEEGTAKPMDVSEKYGIEVSSFDATIEEVNRIQQTLLYGMN